MNNEMPLSSLKAKIERKNYEEKVFNVNYNLISVDAPDGAGKSTFVKLLQKQLQEKYGTEKVVLLAASDFNASDGARHYGQEFSEMTGVKQFSRKHNLYFIGAINKNYREAIAEYLAQDKIVVLDSSEIRALAFMLDMGDEEAISSTTDWLKSGRLTSSLLPGNRIILKVSPEDSQRNLNRRPKLDHGDPTSLAEMEKRQACYQLAIEEVKGAKTESPVNWLSVENPSEDNDIEQKLTERIEKQVIPFLQNIN